MAFERSRHGALDYAPCRYNGSALIMRGPKREIDKNSVVYLGGTETFGKFVAEPFPVLVEQISGHIGVNLGVVNAGVQAFARDQAIHRLANDAGRVVLQVMGAHTMSNRYFQVHPRRNDRFVAPTDALRKLYPEIDFTEFHFTRALLLRLRQVSRKRFATVVGALKRTWLREMEHLLDAIEVPVVVLWVSDHAPPPRGDQKLRRDPLFVDSAMLKAIDVSARVEVVLSPAALATNTRGMFFGPMQAPMAEELLGPAGQCEVAVAVASELGHARRT